MEPTKFPGFEFSHTIIHKNGNICNCGKRGCFETYASLKKFKRKIADEFELNTMDGGIIRDFIRKNPDNATLKYMLNKYIEDLSIGISNIINIFEPDAICIGGSFAEYKDILYEPLKEALLQVDEKLPYRGPLFYQKGEYLYLLRVQGEIDFFQGVEEIYYQTHKIYEGFIQGGIVK